MVSLLKQLKKRRLELNLTQNDMPMRIGVSRQQYQKLESKGNPRLDTLELVAKGLNSELMLIPAEKVAAVRGILESSESSIEDLEHSRGHKSLPDAPWQDLLEDDEL
jgi:transcriptional regulator with XRE-family HTH domain